MEEVRNRKCSKSSKKYNNINKKVDCNEENKCGTNVNTISNTELKKLDDHEDSASNTVYSEKTYSKNEINTHIQQVDLKKFLKINIEIDLVSICLLLCGLFTRMYRLEEPRNIV